MKIMISYQVDTIAEAKAIMEAVDTRGEMTTFRVQDTPQNVVDVFNQCNETKAERINVSPGATSIGKIGSNTKELILESLAVNVQPATKYVEHLKLLWARGEVKFDGNSYYL